MSVASTVSKAPFEFCQKEGMKVWYLASSAVNVGLWSFLSMTVMLTVVVPGNSQFLESFCLDTPCHIVPHFLTR